VPDAGSWRENYPDSLFPHIILVCLSRKPIGDHCAGFNRSSQ
jgi:hypothetical protein